MREIILASKSPRRNYLLKQIVSDFSIDVPVNPEIKPRFYPKKKIPSYLAKQKALEIFQKHPDSLIIAADTVVICKNEILGKPKDKDDVKRMISLLSGRTHIVVTGVYVICKEYHKKFSCVTKVTFKKLSDEEIADYCKLDSVYDKAGAYAIQEDAKKFITGIVGDYNNVIGLPIDELKKYIK